MIVQKIKPSILRQEIKYIYVFKDDGKGLSESHMHLPDGTIDLIFQFGKPLQRKREESYKDLPNLRIEGGYTRSFHLKYPPNFTVVAVVFNPVFVTHFLPQLSDIVSEHSISSVEIFGDEIYEVNAQIKQANSIQEIANHIEWFLSKYYVPRENYYSRQINYAIDLMENNRLNVSEISREVGMSDRNFRRVFKETTGFSPRKMLQLRRGRRLSRKLGQSENLNSLVGSLGYYDVSHLIGDFKSITDLTPQQYIESLDSIDEAFRKTHQ